MNVYPIFYPQPPEGGCNPKKIGNIRSFHSPKVPFRGFRGESVTNSVFHKKMLLLLVVFVIVLAAKAQPTSQGFSTGNPLLPGYFADPTIKKFGDWYYIYATTDGIKLGSGEPSVWVSRDLKNWSNFELDLQVPEGLTNCWAPDVIHGKDGRYYYFMGNCQFGCNIYGYVSDSPIGPFKPINEGKPVIPVGTAKEHLPALDAQFLVEDDGSVYSWFGTWCTSFKGMGLVKMNPENLGEIIGSHFIPIAEIPLAFEAAYPLKYNGKYYLMYSAGDCRLSSYAVHYSVADKPEGPYTPGKNNPVLATNADGTIDGPGHHSILQEGDKFYMVYHRHDNPHSTGGEFRQVCIDEMKFDTEGNILKVEASHAGVEPFKIKNQPKNLALGVKAEASSYYHLISKKTVYSQVDYNYSYLPANAVDDNNGTLWRAGSGALPQNLTLDLGKPTKIRRVATEFEYPTYYYQYKIEVSKDSKNWVVYSDKTNNRTSGCPMIDDNELTGRYLRLTITGTENSGMLAAVWNIKVFDKRFDLPPFANKESNIGPGVTSTGSMLVDFNAEKINDSAIPNAGILGGQFEVVGELKIKTVEGIKAFELDGSNYLKLTKPAPGSLGWNSAFTASVWVYNPEVAEGECLLAWNSRENMLQLSYAALMYGTAKFGAVAHGDWAVDLPYSNLPEKGKWHHIAVTFDGLLENVYVDGELNNQQPIYLFVQASDILIGASGEPTENFTGYISRAQLFDKALTSDEIKGLMQQSKPDRK